MPFANKPERQGDDIWLPDTSAPEAVTWAMGKIPDLLVLFLAACNQRNGERLIEHTKALRHVITRLDQFGRLKMAEWGTGARADAGRAAYDHTPARGEVVELTAIGDIAPPAKSTKE